jgi:predicted PurR-regulated permease PerM
MASEAPSPARQRNQRIAIITLAIVLAGVGLWISASFLPAIIWAAVIAIAIDPLYARAERRWPGGRAHWLPAAATLLTAVLVLVPLGVGVVEAAREAKYVALWLADARQNGLPEPDWVAHLPFAQQVSVWWQENLATPEGTLEQLHRIDRSMIVEQSQLLGKSLIKRAVIFAFTLLALFFVLRDRDRIAEQFRTVSLRLFGPAGERVGTQVVLSVRGTIDGLVLVGIGEGAVLTLAYLVAGVPHAMVLGALTAVAAIIPFGAPILFTVAAALLVGQGAIGWAVAIIVIGTLVLFVADHIIRPILIGGATKLPFLLVLIGILGGLESLGLLGLFVGPAVMATLVLLWRDYADDGEINASTPPPVSPASPLHPDHG